MTYPIRTYIPRKSSILILSAKVLQKQVPKHTHIYLFREETQPNPVIDWMNKRQGTDITDKMMSCMFPIDHISEEERKRNKRTGICPYRNAIACDRASEDDKSRDRETQSQVVGHHIFQHVRNWNVRNINRRQLEEWLPFAYMANIREMSIVWHIPPNMKPEDRLLIFTRRKDQENQQHIDGRTNETTQKRLL